MEVGIRTAENTDEIMPTRVLVIDDESEILEVLETFLSGYFQVTAVDNAKEAHNHIKSGDFDLIVTDMSLPGTSGIEIFDLAKKHLPQAKVIVISGRAETDAACVEVKRRGAADVIGKPFECGEPLIARIKKAIAK